MLKNLQLDVKRLGKPEWRPMLAYVAELHARSIIASLPPFPHPVEEIGPGYCYAPVFGHWDITHALYDSLPVEPEHVRRQLENFLAQQWPDGMFPGLTVLRGARTHASHSVTHPPVWEFLAEEFFAANGDALLPRCFQALERQIGWFEANRRAPDGGYYYLDIVANRTFESGVDDGIRFIDPPAQPAAMVDATAHVYALRDHAARWAGRLGRDATPHRREADRLKAFIQTEMFDEETGFFVDIWRRGRTDLRVHAHEGMWPLTVGAAAPEQAERAIEENLLNPARFFTRHPIATVGVDDPRFELRMWRGPAWNSMTWWAARGCTRYDRPDAARKLLEAALDSSAAVYMTTGVIWEFYHPNGENPELCARKPYTAYNAPCRNYLGHNPLIGMARLWEATRKE